MVCFLFVLWGVMTPSNVNISHSCLNIHGDNDDRRWIQKTTLGCNYKRTKELQNLVSFFLYLKTFIYFKIVVYFKLVERERKSENVCVSVCLCVTIWQQNYSNYWKICWEKKVGPYLPVVKCINYLLDETTTTKKWVYKSLRVSFCIRHYSHLFLSDFLFLVF